jgi:hypothetical protein
LFEGEEIFIGEFLRGHEGVLRRGVRQLKEERSGMWKVVSGISDKSVSSFIFPFLLSIYDFNEFNPTINLTKAPSVLSTGVAYEKRIHSPPDGEKNAPGTTATP